MHYRRSIGMSTFKTMRCALMVSVYESFRSPPACRATLMNTSSRMVTGKTPRSHMQMLLHRTLTLRLRLPLTNTRTWHSSFAQGKVHKQLSEFRNWMPNCCHNNPCTTGGQLVWARSKLCNVLYWCPFTKASDLHLLVVRLWWTHLLEWCRKGPTLARADVSSLSPRQ